MIADLQQLKKDILEVHPSTVEGFSQEMEAAFAAVFAKVNLPMPLYEFSILLTELLATFGDAHTRISYLLPYSWHIPIAIRIMEDSFIVIRGVHGMLIPDAFDGKFQ